MIRNSLESAITSTYASGTKNTSTKRDWLLAEPAFLFIEYLPCQASWSDAKNRLLYNPLFLLSPYVLSPRSHRVTWSELLQAEPWRVDRTGSRVDEDVIEEASKRAAKEWCHHRYLDMVRKSYERHQKTYPEVVAASGPHLMTIPDRIRHQPWAKVTSDVDRITSLPAEARPQAEYEEEQAEREPFVGL